MDSECKVSASFCISRHFVAKQLVNMKHMIKKKQIGEVPENVIKLDFSINLE